MTSTIPVEYWRQRGKTYPQECAERGWWDIENPPLFAILDTLEFGSVLDVGCGFGRVGAALIRHYPHIAYTGVDVSPDMLTVARERLPGAEFIEADLATWDDDRRWDLVVAVSTLGHVHPDDIEVVIAKLRRMANRDLVAIDWNEVGASTPYQWGHDYLHLYGDALKSVTPYGRQDVFHVRP